MKASTLLENSYYQWLKKELVFSEIGNNYAAISTPFFDSNFDNINLYAKFIDSTHIEVSDFGYTISNLEESGITLDRRSKVAWQIYNNVLNDFGISRDDEALVIRASLDKFPVAKNRLLQGIMRINDISYLVKENVKEAFNDIVMDFLKEKDILYTPNVEIPNENGISSQFDFSIPNKNGVELLVKTSARPNDPNYAKVFNYDVKATAPYRNAHFIYILNNVTHHVKLKKNIQNTALSRLDSTVAEVADFANIKQNNTVLVNG